MSILFYDFSLCEGYIDISPPPPGGFVIVFFPLPVPPYYLPCFPYKYPLCAAISPSMGIAPQSCVRLARLNAGQTDATLLAYLFTASVTDARAYEARKRLFYRYIYRYIWRYIFYRYRFSKISDPAFVYAILLWPASILLYNLPAI